MDEASVLSELQGAGALITKSHIVYTSGKHGSDYVNKDAIFAHPRLMSLLCRKLAIHFSDEVEVVVGPAIGGAIIAQSVARQLNQLDGGPEVHAVFAEKDEFPKEDSSTGERLVLKTRRFSLKRGYGEFVRGKWTLVVEDVLTTGESAKSVIQAVRALGAKIVGVGAFVNRGGVTAEMLGVPSLYSLVNVNLEAWDEAECPFCKRGVPVNTEVGKGREYLSRHQPM